MAEEVKAEEVKPSEPNKQVKIKDARVICAKHGDITKSALYFSYKSKTKDGKIEAHNCVFCIPCIAEYLEKLQKAGELADLKMIPVLEDANEGTSDKSESKTESVADKVQGN